MIEIPAALQAKLDNGLTTLCWIWRVIRSDGKVFGFTDHDTPIEFQSLRCLPNSGLESGQVRVEAGTSPARTVVFGALDAKVITQIDLDNGIWDRARIETFRVDWTDPSLYFQTFTGEFGAVQRGANGFEVEIAALSARLSQVIGRVFSKSCDAELGDTRCGIKLNHNDYSAVFTLVRQITQTRFAGSGLDRFEANWFTHGVLSWLSGQTASPPARILTHRSEGELAIVELDRSPSRPLFIGDEARITVGCDKQFETCRGKFSNSENFQGCPHMPGNDVLLRSAHSETVRDGSAR